MLMLHYMQQMQCISINIQVSPVALSFTPSSTRYFINVQAKFAFLDR